MTMKTVLGILGGGGVGYLMYLGIGCRGGACPLWSSPLLSIATGAILGGLIISSF